MKKGNGYQQINKIMWPLLAFFLLLITIVTEVQASVCTALAQGNTASCYTNRASCHYDLGTNRCVDGAAASCNEFVSDKTGCQASGLGCTFATTPNICYNTPPACSLITQQSICVQRSDCQWAAGSCSAHIGTCDALTNQITCATGGCYWDAYLLNCYNTLAEVVSQNPCSTWTDFPLPNRACAYHGCALDVTQTVCLTPGAGGGNATAASTSLIGLFVNPNVSPNTLTFNVDVWLPNILATFPATWYYLSIGGGVPGYDAPPYLAPNVCNNVATFNYSSPPPLYVIVDDPVGEQTYFNNWVTKHSNFNFNATDLIYGNPLYSIMGNLNISNTSSSTIDRYVTLDGTSHYVIHHLSFDLTQIVTNCYQYGATELYSSSNRYYTIPISIIQRDTNNNFAQQSTSFFITVGLAGQFQSITVSSQYQPVIYQNELTLVTSTCPAGQGMLNIVYLLQIQNVFDQTRFVGPRNTSDILFTSGSINNTLHNCYGEHVVSVQRQGCINNICYTYITTQTKCRTLRTDGQAFNNCTFAETADRQADIGVNGTYSSMLNGVHTFWVNDYSCPFTANQTNNWKNCTLAVSSPYSFPDIMNSNITINTYPETDITLTFDAYAGMLPSPNSDLSLIETLSQGPNSVYNVADLFNTQLQWNSQFTFAIGVLDPTLRAYANITLQPQTLFRIDGLDAQGNVLSGSTPLYIDDVFPYMTYVPKLLLWACTHGCKNTPATANQTAYDSFSIPVISLRALLPASGYAVSVAYQINIPLALHAAPLSHKPGKLHLFNTGNSEAQLKQSRLHMPLSNDETQQMQHGMKAVGVENQVTSLNNYRIASRTTFAEHASWFKTEAVNAQGQAQSQYTFDFLINDGGNPYPPVIPINVTVNGTNTIVLVRGYQFQMALFVDSASNVLHPFTNTTGLIHYATSVLPGAIANTLAINPNQVTYIQGYLSPPFNSLSVKDKLQSRKLRKSFQTEANTKFKVEVAIATPLYITFVLIPSPNVTQSTIDGLAASLSASINQLELQANLYLSHVIIDTNTPLQSVPVIVPATPWYLNPGTAIITTTTTTTTTGASSSVSWAAAGGLLLFTFMSAVICVLCFWVYRHRRNKQHTYQHLDKNKHKHKHKSPRHR